jgi:hypothetical protein
VWRCLLLASKQFLLQLIPAGILHPILFPDYQPRDSVRCHKWKAQSQGHPHYSGHSQAPVCFNCASDQLAINQGSCNPSFINLLEWFTHTGWFITRDITKDTDGGCGWWGSRSMELPWFFRECHCYPPGISVCLVAGKLLGPSPFGFLKRLHCLGSFTNRLSGQTQQSRSILILLGFSVQHSYLQVWNRNLLEWGGHLISCHAKEAR